LDEEPRPDEAEPVGGVGAKWVLRPERILLREQITRRTGSERLAGLYWESIRALNDPENSARHAIAGHLLRELMDGLPKVMDVPEERDRLRDFFQWLLGAWQRLTRTRALKTDRGLWNGDAIDDRLGKFLGELDSRVERYAATQVRRRDVQQRVLGNLDAGFGAVAAPIQDTFLARWMDTHDMFTLAAHHGLDDLSKLEAAAEVFEELLRDRLAPRSFEKEDLIAAIVQEGEARADA
jgi:hypothetical protein